MSEVSDHWFVRFPDGRIVRAANTTVVRQQVTLGKIPPNSSVRRFPGDEWTTLEWTREFADLGDALLVSKPPKGKRDAEDAVDLGNDLRPAADSAEAGGLSARLDRTRLPTIGVRGMAHELLAALDATLVRKKLAAAALAGLAWGVVLASWLQVPETTLEAPAQWARTVVAAVLLLAIGTAAAGMLTRMTFYELSRMRPATWREGATGLLGTACRIAAAQLLTAGLALLVIVYLRLLPRFLLDYYPTPGGGQTAAAALAAVGMIVELVLWPIVSFALLLPPIRVVEDCSIGKALILWLRLLREDIGRVFLYEALALGLGLAATLLLALPWLALFAYEPVEFPQLLPAITFTRTVLAGLALAPLLAYLMVANVFIYINLRYERAPAGRRQKSGEPG